MGTFTYTALIGPLLFAALGLLVLLAFLPQWRLARASAAWPRVAGEIVASAAVKRRVSTSDGVDETLSARITYVYQVAGRRHQGNRVIAGPLGVLFARRAVRRYRKGDACRVAYDPARPQSSVLEPGLHVVHWLFPAMGLLFLALGVWMFGVMLRAGG